MCEHLGRCSVPSAYNTGAGSAEPLISRSSEMMRRGWGDPGKLDPKTSRPESGKREMPLRCRFRGSPRVISQRGNHARNLSEPRASPPHTHLSATGRSTPESPRLDRNQATGIQKTPGRKAGIPAPHNKARRLEGTFFGRCQVALKSTSGQGTFSKMYLEGALPRRLGHAFKAPSIIQWLV